MTNLLDAMETIKQKREKLLRETNAKVEAFDEAYRVLWELNEACPTCKGAGKKLRTRACAEDDRPDPYNPNDWETCHFCGGTGRISEDKK